MKKMEMLMFKKHVRKSSAVLALCGLLLLTLLTGLGSANAQTIRNEPHPQPHVRVINAATVIAPHRSGVVQAICPFNYRVENGHVKVFRITRKNAMLPRNAFSVQASGPLAGHRGWNSRVYNNSGLKLRAQVTATCAR